MAHDEVTKSHPGGVSGVLTNEKLARVYETSDENDGYKAMKLYISKLNPKSDAFFQYPKKQWNYDDEVWYDARPIGVNKLDNMMKSISEAAKLSKIKCSPTTALGPLRSPCGQMPESKIAILWQYLVTVVSRVWRTTTRDLPLHNYISEVLSGSLTAESSYSSATAINTRTQIQDKIEMTAATTSSSYRHSIFNSCTIQQAHVHITLVQIPATEIDLTLACFSA